MLLAKVNWTETCQSLVAMMVSISVDEDQISQITFQSQGGDRVIKRLQNYSRITTGTIANFQEADHGYSNTSPS